MSRTISIGVVGLKYWRDMATVMIECLNGTLAGGKPVIPINILRDAIKFFKVVLGQKSGETVLDNHLAQAHARGLAWKILNNWPSLQSRTLNEVNEHFRRFAEFLKKIEDLPTVPLGAGSGKQLDRLPDGTIEKTACDLRDFFGSLLILAARENR